MFFKLTFFALCTHISRTTPQWFLSYFLQQALRDVTGDGTYIFDPIGIVTDEHGGNRSSIQKMLKDDMVARAKSCESHFYDCAHRVAKSDWSPKSKAEFLTLVHEIYCAETPTAYEAKRRHLMDWASKEKRSHAKPWFNKFWHVRRYVIMFILVAKFLTK